MVATWRKQPGRASLKFGVKTTYARPESEPDLTKYTDSKPKKNKKPRLVSYRSSRKASRAL